MIEFAKIKARSANEIVFSGDPPDNIQWMPAGEHEITASRNGEPAKLTVAVTEEIVNALNKSLEEIKAQGFEAYFDFNHEDKEASGWVESFYWAGEDPVTGGIRAKVKWSEEGAKAIKGGSYKRFSPTFLTDAKGKVIGTTPNAGGLVNRPAFREIAAVMAAKDALETDLRFVSASEMPEEPEDKPNRNNAMTDDQLKEMQKLEAENEELKKEVDALKAKYKAADEENEKMKAEAKEREVESVVQFAISSQKVTAKDEKAINAIKAVAKIDAANAKTFIESMPSVVNAGLTQRWTPAATQADGSTVNAADQMNRAIAEIKAKNPGITGQDAFDMARQANPDLFK